MIPAWTLTDKICYTIIGLLAVLAVVLLVIPEQQFQCLTGC